MSKMPLGNHNLLSTWKLGHLASCKSLRNATKSKEHVGISCGSLQIQESGAQGRIAAACSKKIYLRRSRSAGRRTCASARASYPRRHQFPPYYLSDSLHLGTIHTAHETNTSTTCFSKSRRGPALVEKCSELLARSGLSSAACKQYLTASWYLVPMYVARYGTR